MLNLRASETLYTKEKNQRGINFFFLNTARHKHYSNNSGKKDIIDVRISLIQKKLR